MELLFLYVKEFGCLKNARLHFSSAYRFGYSDKDSRLQVVAGTPLPSSFFSMGKSNGSSVEAVSSIVGANGSGKTTIARFLRQVFLSQDNISDFILVVKIRKRIDCYFKSSDTNGRARDLIIVGEKSVSKHPWSPHNTNFDSARNAFQFVYLTPHYTSERVVADDGKEVVDLSTTGLMVSRPEYYANQEAGERISVPQNLVYQAEQTEWMLLFLRALQGMEFSLARNKRKRRLMAIPTPRGLRIAINGIAREVNRAHFAQRNGGARGGAVDYQDLRRILNTHARSFFGNVFLAFAGNYWKDMGVREDVPNWDVSFGKALLEFCRRPFEQTVNGCAEDGDIWFSRENIMRFLDDPGQYLLPRYYDTTSEPKLKAIRFFFESLANLNRAEGGRGTPDSIEIDVCSDMRFDIALGLVKAHREACVITSILQFEFYPHLSAGELSAMFMWGRLYWQFVMNRQSDSATVERERRGAVCREVLLFLDEAETTMHPAWQRRLVRTMILFFELFVPNVSVHVIFATHSPLILSDIPSSNVCCLDRRRDGATVTNMLRRSRLPNTFAASIGDLYLIPFFLNEGTTGEFATSKVNRLLKRLIKRGCKDFRDLSPEWIAVAEMVGDPLLRKYVQNALGRFRHEDKKES